MSPYKTIKIESAAHVTTLTFKRPNKSNSITREFMSELESEADELSTNTETRCLIVSGNGRSFCSGLDLDVLVEFSTTEPADQLRELLGHWQSVFDKLERLPQLTIAAINGPVLGAGLELVLACDFRIASTRAFFGMPQVKMGVIPDLGGLGRLTRTVGPSWTKEIVFRGRNFNAMEALRVGLVNRVSEPGDLVGTAQKWAAQFAALSPAAVRSAKELINSSFDLESSASAKMAREAQADLVRTEEFSLAIRAAREAEPVEGQ